MFTYGDGVGKVDISRAAGLPLQPGLHRHGDRRPADLALRRDGGRGRPGGGVQREAEVSHGYVSGGFFVFQREFLDYLDDDPDLLFEHAPLQTLAREGELAVFPHHDFWMGMDTYRGT